MDHCTQQTEPASAEPQIPGDAGTALGDLAVDTAGYVRAWSGLLASETRLAGVSLVRMVFALLIVPAIAFAICLSVDALLAALVQRWLQDWASSVAIVLCFNLACLYGVLAGIRRCWHDLSLPRSRAALAKLVERMT